jgi:type III secretion system YscI/HrpB-like protein
MADPIIAGGVPIPKPQNTSDISKGGEGLSPTMEFKSQEFRAKLQADVSPEITPNVHFGDVAVNSLRQKGKDLSESWKDIHSKVSDTSSVYDKKKLGVEDAKLPSASDLLAIQARLIRVSFEYELIGKAVNRMTQNIDQLTKLQ